MRLYLLIDRSIDQCIYPSYRSINLSILSMFSILTILYILSSWSILSIVSNLVVSHLILSYPSLCLCIYLNGKRLTERPLFFQPWRVHFACVFSRICVWVLFWLWVVKSCDKLLLLFYFLCLRLSRLCFTCVSGLEEVKISIDIKSVLEGTWRSEERSIKSVSGRYLNHCLTSSIKISEWKVLEEVP